MARKFTDEEVAELIGASAELVALLDNGSIEVWKWGPYGDKTIRKLKSLLKKRSQQLAKPKKAKNG